VTHRGMVSSITPIALPAGNARQINEKLVRQLKSGTFNIFQLDATAYPGNSGSPVFDVASGEVIGVINMVFIKGSKEAALSQPSGITYAIPANYLDQLNNK
jgi:serine protease Do